MYMAGELKKTLAEHTGLHHQDQKLIYKKKVRDSKEYLDVAGVKNGSRMVLVEDIASRERRCLEMIRNANIEKASKLLSQIRLQVDNFAERVTSVLFHLSDSLLAKISCKILIRTHFFAFLFCSNG